MNNKSVFIYMVFLMLGVVVFNGTIGQAAVIQVTTTEDNVPGSLRTAITTANANNKDNTIYVPAGVYLLSGTLGINTGRNLTIIGAGSTQTFIDGNGMVRVLHISNGTVSIFDLAIVKGSGSGIYNGANLTLTRCVIRENAAADGGCWHSYGFPGDPGGGIYNDGVLTLDKCTISFNRSGMGGRCPNEDGEDGDGGGVFNNGTLTMTGCTVSYNSGQYGRGGGIFNNADAYLTLTNCTISDNHAGGGGGLYNSGNSQLISVTVVSNRGCGIFNEGSISLKNSLVANNSAYYGYGPDCVGIFNWVCYSLIGDTKDCTLTGFQKANILGKDPVLGLLQDNGGPTFTHALLFGSPAIDAGNSSDLSDDQRGYTRPVDIPGIANVSDGADIGAIELNELNVYYSISGRITYGGSGFYRVTLTFSNNGGSTTTNQDGNYSQAVPYYWSGTVTPVKEGYTFIPSSRDYTAVTEHLSHQDYTAVSLFPPQISLNRTQLYFGANTSGKQTGPQSFLISNSGGGILKWTAAADVNWLSCNPASGSGPAVVTVSINPSGLATGTYYGSIKVADPNAVNSPQIVSVTLIVYDSSSKHLPWGSFDTPLNGATVTGSIPVTGWALDNIGIESVKIYRDPAAGEGSGLVYIGTAVMVEGARPDIETAFPGYPNNYKAGWGYLMLTNGLPNQGNGAFTLYANAVDKEGNVVNLGKKTIYGDNAHAVKPFGALDTPAQGGAASGSNYINFGWALTPLPNTIPFNGSTITVWVDGIPLGHPVYNEKRPDVAAFFPTYNNSAGAGGHFYLDTTTYQNGVHTISWSVSDDAGNVDGIGSRYFTVENLALAGSSVQGEDTGVMGRWGNGGMGYYFEPLRLKKGYNPEDEPGILFPDENGRITIEIRELERIEIQLTELTENSPHLTLNNTHLTLNNTPSTYYYGYLTDGDRLKPLPIGSTLDAVRGIFYWQPGPGFIGAYEFLFIEKNGAGELKPKQFTVRIRPTVELGKKI